MDDFLSSDFEMPLKFIINYPSFNKVSYISKPLVYERNVSRESV